MFGSSIAPDCDDTLGGRISIAREACGLSAEDAAERLGVLPASWNAWERDRDVPRANRLAMMAGILGVSPAWLLTGLGAGPSEQRPDNDPAELRRALRQAEEDIEALNRRMRQIASRLEGEDGAQP